MRPAVLIPIGMVATFGITVYVRESIRNNDKVPEHRGEAVVVYKYPNNIRTWYYDPDEEVTYLKTRSCRLIHGSVSWLITGIKNVFTLGQLDPLEHWWIIVRTTESFYVIQFYKNNVYTMIECDSQQECDMNGLNCVNGEKHATIWTQNSYTGYPRSGITLDDIVQWIKEKHFPANFSFVSHNCQDLCKAVWNAFKQKKKIFK